MSRKDLQKDTIQQHVEKEIEKERKPAYNTIY